MNIFEALEAATDGLVTLPEWQGKCFVFINAKNQFFEWKKNTDYTGTIPTYSQVGNYFLKRNDWIPYIEVKKDWAKPFGITESNFSLWETWFKRYFEFINIGFSEAYVKDFLPPPANVPPGTKKCREVFENVISIKLGFVKTGNIEKLFNKQMKLTLEWEE